LDSTLKLRERPPRCWISYIASLRESQQAVRVRKLSRRHRIWNQPAKWRQ
jgi:hypothetical protein